MAPDAPTPDPSPAEVLADTMDDQLSDGYARGYADRAIAALDAAGYEIVRKVKPGLVNTSDPATVAVLTGRCSGCGSPSGYAHYTGCLNSTSAGATY